MNMTLTRTSRGVLGIFGELTAETGHVAVTLEHAYLTPDGWQPKLPPGEYLCKTGKHILHGMAQHFDTFEITGVKGHTGILFHPGNKNSDSDGCVLLGSAVDESAMTIVASKIAFQSFMRAQSGAQSFTLTVVNNA